MSGFIDLEGEIEQFSGLVFGPFFLPMVKIQGKFLKKWLKTKADFTKKWSKTKVAQKSKGKIVYIEVVTKKFLE